MSDQSTTTDDDLRAYYRRLYENPDTPLGEFTARELLARTMATLAEHREAMTDIMQSTHEALTVIATDVRRASALLDDGQPEAAAEVLRDLVAGFDGYLRTAEPAGRG